MVVRAGIRVSLHGRKRSGLPHGGHRQGYERGRQTTIRERAMTYYVGLDLGQANDYTAIAVVEETGERGESPLHIRHLERPPLGTYYPEQVARVKELVSSPELSEEGIHPWSRKVVRVSADLVVDATGVGRPVVDMLRKEGLSFSPVLITGGDVEHREHGFYRVPKRNLVSSVQIALQSGQLKIAEDLELAETLRRELLNFRIKVNISTAHDSYEAWREGDHDDLVLAVALACWSTRKHRGATVYTFRY